MDDLFPEVIADIENITSPVLPFPVLPSPDKEEINTIPEMPVKVIDGNEYIALINIPSLELELPVFSTCDYKMLDSAPCHFYGSVYTGDFVVCAHNYSKHFGKIKNLSIGDPVIVVDMDGNAFNYEVVEVETLNPTDIEDMINGEGWDLTLFTCTLGGATRVTVRCALAA